MKEVTPSLYVIKYGYMEYIGFKQLRQMENFKISASRIK